MKNLTGFWTQFRFDIRVRKLHARTQVQVYRAPSGPGICTPLRARARESLIASSLSHYKMGKHIYTPTSLYNFPIWDIPYSLQFFNSMSLLWAISFHSPINYFGHINIQNWFSHGREQQSTLTWQKSLINLIYFNVPKCQITQFNTNFPTTPS